MNFRRWGGRAFQPDPVTGARAWEAGSEPLEKWESSRVCIRQRAQGEGQAGIPLERAKGDNAQQPVFS